MAQLFTLPGQEPLSSAGVPMSGCKLTFSITGTSTAQNTYQDVGLTIPHLNPVAADADGLFPAIYLDPSLPNYRVVLSTSAGVVLKTWDGVPSGALTAEIVGQLLYPRTALEISAGVTPATFHYPQLDPRRYSNQSDWSVIYGSVSVLSNSYDNWYRGDHAQHPSLTNCIVGFHSYDDSAMTGTFGYSCTALGVNTLLQNSSSTVAGGSNTAIGYASQRDSVDTSGNTSVGAFTLGSVTGVNSAHNGAFGHSVFQALVSGTGNNGFAYRCMYQLVTGNNNTGMGDVCMHELRAGTGNTAYGYQAGYSKLGGYFTHAYGYQALFNEQSALISGITKAASAVVTISTVSSINPFSVGQPVVIESAGGMTQINGLTSGLVSAIGGSSGAWTITITINSSGFSTYTSGGYLAPLGNCVFGYRAGYNVSMRGGCTLIGFDAAQTAEPGFGTTIVGYQAGLAINCNIGGSGGELNTLIGYWAARGLTSGAANVVIGEQSAAALTTGSEHVIIGPNAGSGISTAIRNVAIGSTTAVNLNGNSNTSVGYNAGTQASAQTYTNCGSFGANAVPTASNQITLGDSSIATLRCQQTTITALSDARFKKNVRPLELPAGALEDLQPVLFEWIEQGMPQGVQMGFIAQALDEWQKKWELEWMGLVDKSNPDRWEATPFRLFFPLILSFQKLSARVAALEAA